MSKSRHLINTIYKHSKMKGWSKPPIYTPLNTHEVLYKDVHLNSGHIKRNYYADIVNFKDESITGNVSQNFGFKNISYPNSPYNKFDIKFKNYNNHNDDIEIIQYTCLPDKLPKNTIDYVFNGFWFIKFLTPGEYHLEITRNFYDIYNSKNKLNVKNVKNVKFDIIDSNVCCQMMEPCYEDAVWYTDTKHGFYLMQSQ